MPDRCTDPTCVEHWPAEEATLLRESLIAAGWTPPQTRTAKPKDAPMSDPRDDLAAEIRKHIAEADDHIPEGYWWYDDGRDDDLPEALAADLIAAGWRHD